MLPSAQLAYETGLSAGSIAVLADGHLGACPPWKWIPHPELHRAKTRVPGERIADNALGALKMVARDDLHVQGCLILSQVGLLFPVNHAPLKLASLTGFAPVISCMRGRHVGWTTPQGQKW